MEDDTLTIPPFLRRDLCYCAAEPEPHAPHRAATVPFGYRPRTRRQRKIAYPTDGYLGKGLRAAAREALRERRRRHAVKCRQRPAKKGGR